MEYLTQRQVPKTRFLVFSKSVTLTRWLWSRWQVLWLFTEMVLIVKVHMVARPGTWGREVSELGAPALTGTPNTYLGTCGPLP